MSIIQGRQICQDLKFVQLKKYQLSNENHSGTGLCITVDHRTQTIIACCQNELIYVPLISLLNFDVWSKSFLKNVDFNIPDRIVITINQSAPTISSHLISTSRQGFGTKLAVACNDGQSSSLFLLFYSLDYIYLAKQKSEPYNRFNFPITVPSTKVRLLSWHPEMADNVFACSLNDGSLYIVYIDDFPEKTVSILFKLAEDRQVSAFCWSPKGKQIVISFNNSFFSQFKTPFNENKLVQSTNFQESKRNQLPGDYGSFRITNIHWISTFNFLMACRNRENNVIFLMVSIPSSKATGADAVMKIVDFGNLIIEMIDTPEPFEDYIFPLQHLFFTYTNKSSDLVLLGCSQPNQLNVCENWAEITVDDDFRLMLDDFLLIRGLNFMHGTPKQIKINGFDKGGDSRPYALIYDSKGQLTLFLVDYEDYENCSFNSTYLKVHLPSQVIKPKIAAENLAEYPPADLPTDQIVAQPIAANVNGSFSTKSNVTNSQPIFINQSTPIAQPPVSSVPKATNSISFSGTKDSTKSPGNVPTAQASKVQMPLLGDKTVTVSATASSKNSDVDQMKKNLYISEILNNIKEFSEHLETSIASLKETLNRTQIGSTKDFENIKFETEFIMDMLEKLSSSFSSLNQDVDDLKKSCLELEYLLEEIRSLSNRNMDPNYRYILQKKNLDPLTSRRMKEIYSLRDYIEIQLRELNAKFDLEWQEWLQKMKRSLSRSSSSSSSSHSPYLFRHSDIGSKVRSPPTSPHSSFIGSSGSRNKANSDHQEYARLDENLGWDARNANAIIYKALVKNQRLIDNLRQQIQFLARKIALIKHKHTTLDLRSNHEEDVHELSRLLNETALSGSMQPGQTAEAKSMVVLQCLPTRTKCSLKQFLEQRHSVPIRVCQPCHTNDGDPLNEKSRFISVLEKIKAKHLQDVQRKNVLVKQNGKTDEITISPPKPSSNAVVNVQKTGDLKPPAKSAAKTVPQAKPLVVPKSESQTNSIPAAAAAAAAQQPQPPESTKPVKTIPTVEVPTFSFKLPASKPATITTAEPKVTLSPNQSDRQAAPKQQQTSKINAAAGPAVVGANVSSSSTTTTTTTSSSTNQATTTFPMSLKTAFPTISSSLFGSPDNSNTNSITSVTPPVVVSKKTEEKPTPPPPPPPPATTTTTVAKPFIFNTAISGSGVTNLASTITTPQPPPTSTPVATTSHQQQQQPAQQISLKTAFPTISSSLFGNHSDDSKSVPNAQIGLKAKEKPPTPTPATTTTAAAGGQQPFSFSAAISSLAISSGSGSTNVTSSTSAQTASIFGSFSSSANSAFGQANTSSTGSTQTASGAAPSLFSSTPNPLGGGSVFKACSPEQPKSTFGSFSFGGNANNNNNNNTSTSSSVFSTSVTSGLPVFGASPLSSSSNQSISTGGGGGGGGGGGSIFAPAQPPPPNSATSPFSFATTTTTNQSPPPPNQKPFSLFAQTTSPAFGSPNTSGGTVFGGNPVFGGSPSFGATFGAANNLMANNSMPVQSFTAINTNHTFGSMAFKNEPMPSFDSLAADNNNKNMAAGGGGQFFQTTITPNTGAFTQRRG